MHILIADDERPARDKLRRLLAAQPGIESIAEARDGNDVLRQVAQRRPDAIFLDIQMPELDGIACAGLLPEPAPPVVFVTAYDDYAVAAFDANAIDYLLKPYDEARLLRALARLRVRTAQAPACEQLVVGERGRIEVVRTADIAWLEAADNYVVLHTATGKPWLRQTLTGLLEKLGPAFLRTQRGAAVNLAHVASVEPLGKGDCDVILRGGARVPCSRQYRGALLEKLGRGE